jgi:hypothetical protein
MDAARETKDGEFRETVTLAETRLLWFEVRNGSV